MGDFSADWLALREPADRAARSGPLTSEIVERVGREDLRALDVATGTGANLRYLAPHFGARQRWCLVDKDLDLLGELSPRVAAWALDLGCVLTGNAEGFAIRGSAIDWWIESRPCDLARLADPSLFADRNLITTSALLDLVSERWLQKLAAHCREAGSAVLFALTYDGRMTCAPPDSDDDLVRTLVNRHQRRNKGFGRALGPDAPACAARVFAAAGYEVRQSPSDWQLTPAQAGLQRELIEGWAQAAAEIEPDQIARFDAWKARRLDAVAAGTSEIVVGHQDLAGWC